MVARYGGEEFAVILPEINGSVAKSVVERVRRAVAATPFVLPDGREIGVTVSIGVSCYPNCAASPRPRSAAPTRRCTSPKQAGRNRVLLYRETLKARIEKDPDLIVALLRENPDNVLPVVSAVAAKAPFLHLHADKVLEAVVLAAQALGLAAEERDALRLAAQLHDIGMVTIPDALLAKTTALTPEEWGDHQAASGNRRGVPGTGAGTPSPRAAGAPSSRTLRRRGLSRRAQGRGHAEARTCVGGGRLPMGR